MALECCILPLKGNVCEQMPGFDCFLNAVEAVWWLAQQAAELELTTSILQLGSGVLLHRMVSPCPNCKSIYLKVPVLLFYTEGTQQVCITMVLTTETRFQSAHIRMFIPKSCGSQKFREGLANFRAILEDRLEHGGNL